MSTPTELDKLRAEEFSERCRDAMIPLSNTFSYFPAMPLGEEDVKDYLDDPIAALPLGVASMLRKVSILLVPYLERVNGKEKQGGPVDLVSFEPPPENRQVWFSLAGTLSEPSIVFAIKEREVADYHYDFYHAMATLSADHMGEEDLDRYYRVLREELGNNVHGEVDERGWHLKQNLLRRQTNVRRESKLFREYARQSFIDTMTLYLHGICCDIDIETGPRQIPSRFLRRRLELLESMFPPPQGYAVFPEELSR